LKYQPDKALTLTRDRYPAREQCQVGSLTGAVTSEKVTEVRNGSLKVNGNHLKSVKA
jgi:hypothetical protein